jgi:hypothetical protein
MSDSDQSKPVPPVNSAALLLNDPAKPKFVDISLYYTVENANSDTPRIVILEDKEAEERLEDPKRQDSVLVLNTKWKLATWKDQNSILKSSQKREDPLQPGVGINIEWTDYRDFRIKKFLADWDICDAAGIKIPVTPESIDTAVPQIMLALLDKYDEITLLGEEESGK